MKKTMVMVSVLFLMTAGGMATGAETSTDEEIVQQNETVIGAPCLSHNERINAGGWTEEEWEERMSEKERGGEVLFQSLNEDQQNYWNEIKSQIQAGTLSKDAAHAKLQEEGIDVPVRQQKMLRDGSGEGTGERMEQGQQQRAGNGQGAKNRR